MTPDQEQAIASDLDLCDIIAVLGSPAAKRKAARHRKACLAAIREANERDGLNGLSDDELLAELLG